MFAEKINLNATIWANENMEKMIKDVEFCPANYTGLRTDEEFDRLFGPESEVDSKLESPPSSEIDTDNEELQL